MAGNGVCGVAVSFLRVVTKAALPDTHDGIVTSTLIYFGAAVLVVIFCIIGVTAVLKVGYIKDQADDMDTKRRLKYGKLKDEESPGSADMTPVVENGDVDGTNPEDVNVDVDAAVNGDGKSDDGENENDRASEEQALIGSPTEDDDEFQSKKKHRTWSILKKEAPFAFSVFFTFFVTISIFPGLTVTIPSSNGLGSWYPVILIVLFNVFDLIGRSSASKLHTILPSKRLVLLSSLRIIFLPLFILCIHPKLFVADWWAAVFMVFMALSNGLFSSVAMMSGPPAFKRKSDQETAGNIMTFFLLLGICAGSTFGLILNFTIFALW
jgi:hypothetical protein